ncbi:MAG: hypothetical protein ABFE07_00195 [Armatimonadia bacterium]
MDKDREAFEAHIRSLLPHAKFDRDDCGEYIAVMVDARWMGWQAALAYARQNGEVCLSCGTHSMNARCDCTRLGSSELRRPAVCVSLPGKD